MTQYIVTDYPNNANKILFNAIRFLEKRTAFSSKDNSPTGSWESNHRWARQQYFKCLKINQYLDLPAYSLTIKLNQYYDGPQITNYLEKLNRNIKRKLNDNHLYAIAYKEIEANNLVHLHLLVWSNLPIDEINELIPRSIPRTLNASLPYSTPTDNPPAYIAYITGYCKKQKLLFKSRSIGRHFKYLGSLNQSLAKEIDANVKLFDKKKPLDLPRLHKAVRTLKRFLKVSLEGYRGVKNKELGGNTHVKNKDLGGQIIKRVGYFNIVGKYQDSS